MFKLNLKIAWRNLWKHKGYTLINILGLSIGMASCILLFIFIRYQLSFDAGFQNEDRIFRMVTDWKYSAYDDYSEGVPIPMVKVAKDEIPGLEKTAAIARRYEIIHVNDDSGKEIIKSDESVYYTEPDFFEIFNTEWLLGKPALSLGQPNTVALSETTAQKYFGNTGNSIGKSITIGDKILKVTGVFRDIPQNSSFPLKIVMSYQSFPQKNDECWDCVGADNEFYVLLKDELTANDLKGSLAKFNKKYYMDKKIAGNQNNRFESLKDIHFSERYGNFADNLSSINNLK